MDPAEKVKGGLASREPAVPGADTWRIPYLGKLLEERDTQAHQGAAVPDEEVERVQELVDSLCSN